VKTANKAFLRWLRVCHILTASLWFGGVAAVLVGGGAALYPRLIFPAALLTVTVGFLYSACTPWGFFRFRWVTAKWVLTLLALLLACLGALWDAAPEGFIAFAQAILLAASVVVAVLKPGGRKILLFAPPKKERTEEELRESIEKDRRPL